MSPKKVGIGVFAAIALIITLSFASQIFETNDKGYYQIKQASFTGEMTVRNDPGLYAQLFGDIFTYSISDMYYFSKHEIDGPDSPTSDPIKVRFNDGGTALVSGSIKFRLSTTPEKQLLLHNDFRSYTAVHGDLIRQVVTESLMQTATLMRAEESYSTRRSEFTSLAEDQIIKGIFETTSKRVKKKDADGNEFIEQYVNVKLNVDGSPVVRKASPLGRYDIQILQFVIKDIDFDETIDALIAKKKEAEQQKVVAKANAERAKQDAITAREQGNANIATAKAAKEVEKIRAVTDAKKAFEVSVLQRKQAEEDSKARLVKQKAEADANKLLVRAGLTPQEKAEWHYKTRVGVAEKLSQVKLPGMMILGGGNGGQALNPFDAVGLESFMRISNKLAKPNK